MTRIREWAMGMQEATVEETTRVMVEMILMIWTRRTMKKETKSEITETQRPSKQRRLRRTEPRRMALKKNKNRRTPRSRRRMTKL